MDAERAHERARRADEAIARDEDWGPLHGVPFTLKDAHATAGMRTTTGFPPLDHTPQEDSTVAARLKAAGGILIGKTIVLPYKLDRDGLPIGVQIVGRQAGADLPSEGFPHNATARRDDRKDSA